MKVNRENLITENRISLKQKLFLVLIVLSAISLFLAASTLTALAQTRPEQTKNKQEKIVKKVSFENEPIEFLSLESDGKTIRQDEKFVREDDWLKDFTIKFKNVSGKPITYVSIVISFPETGSTVAPIAHFLRYGVNPLVKNNKGESKLLAPNDNAEVKLSAEDFKALKAFVAQSQLLADLTEANFRIMVVYFEDGTQWGAGTTFRPDPNNAGKFIPVNE